MLDSDLLRLRLGFWLLAALLLLPLGMLVREAEARFDAQRRLRHEIVAERIFDEMERELTGLLEVENARPSSAYETDDTRIGSWSPFVVGYFRYDGDVVTLAARDQLPKARAQRVKLAVATLQERGDLSGFLRRDRGRPLPVAAPQGPASGGSTTGADVFGGNEWEAFEREADGALGGMAAPAKGASGAADKAEKTSPASASAPTRAKQKKSAVTRQARPLDDAVLRQLNRAGLERRKKVEQKSKEAQPAVGQSAMQDDPLSGF